MPCEANSTICSIGKKNDNKLEKPKQRDIIKGPGWGPQVGKRQLCNHPKDKDKDWGSGNGSSHYCFTHRWYQRCRSKLEWLAWLDWQLDKLGEGLNHSSRIHI